jgi:DNA-binding phage protein
MALTRSYNETVRQDLRADPEFRRALLGEVLGCMAAGDIETGKSVLRKYIEGTVGFETLGEALGRSPKSLMRMLGPTGNPHVRTFFEMVAHLQKLDGTVLTVQGVRKLAA